MPRAALTEEEIDITRKRLSRAALEIYRREGLDAISFRRIADALSISHTRSYRYFENKDALLAWMRTEAVERLDDFLDSRVSDGDRGSNGIWAMVRGFIAYVRTFPEDYLLIFGTHQPPPTRYPELLAARRKVFDRAVAIVEHEIGIGALAGPARELTHAVWVTLHGLMTLHVANQLVHGYDLDELVEPVIERLLAAAATRNIPSRSSIPTTHRSVHSPIVR